jgi:hypothetical protein
MLIEQYSDLPIDSVKIFLIWVSHKEYTKCGTELQCYTKNVSLQMQFCGNYLYGLTQNHI